MSRYGYVRTGIARYKERFGLSFEDLEVGLHVRHRPGTDISQQDNREEAVEMINNAQLHYDSHYAARTEWQRPVGVSTMTVQRLMGMISRTWYRRRSLLGIERISLTRPVFGGDTLYSESIVSALQSGDDPDVGIVSLLITGSNQRGEAISEIACRIEIYRRGMHPEDGDDAPIAEEERFSLYRRGADGVLVEQTGLAFEDMVEGETFDHWPGRTIDEEESRLHALRSMEINPRWHDAAYIRRSKRQEQTVFEPLVLGVVTALSTRTLGRVAANLGWTDIVMPRPVRIGETIYAESTIGPLRLSSSRPGQGIAQVATRGYVESGELVCSYKRALLVYRRGAGPYESAGY